MPQQAAQHTWAASQALSVWLLARQLPSALSLLRPHRPATAHRSCYVRDLFVRCLMHVRPLALF